MRAIKSSTAVQQQFEKQQTRKSIRSLIDRKITRHYGLRKPPYCRLAESPTTKISHCEGRYALTRWQRINQDEILKHCVALFPKQAVLINYVCTCLNSATLLLATLFTLLKAPKSSRLMLHARELDIFHPQLREIIKL